MSGRNHTIRQAKGPHMNLRALHLVDGASLCGVESVSTSRLRRVAADYAQASGWHAGDLMVVASTPEHWTGAAAVWPFAHSWRIGCRRREVLDLLEDAAATTPLWRVDRVVLATGDPKVVALVGVLHSRGVPVDVVCAKRSQCAAFDGFDGVSVLSLEGDSVPAMLGVPQHEWMPRVQDVGLGGVVRLASLPVQESGRQQLLQPSTRVEIDRVLRVSPEAALPMADWQIQLLRDLVRDLDSPSAEALLEVRERLGREWRELPDVATPYLEGLRVLGGIGLAGEKDWHSALAAFAAARRDLSKRWWDVTWRLFDLVGLNVGGDRDWWCDCEEFLASGDCACDADAFGCGCDCDCECQDEECACDCQGDWCREEMNRWAAFEDDGEDAEQGRAAQPRGVDGMHAGECGYREHGAES